MSNLKKISCLVVLPLVMSCSTLRNNSDSWTEWRGSTYSVKVGVPNPTGTGSCRTGQDVFYWQGRIAVVVRRPQLGSDCVFKSLHLVIGTGTLDILPLSGTRGFSVVDTDYKGGTLHRNLDGSLKRERRFVTWSKPIGVLFFDTNNTYSNQELENASLWEHDCGRSIAPVPGREKNSCLTDEKKISTYRLPHPDWLENRSNTSAPSRMSLKSYVAAYHATNNNLNPFTAQGFIAIFGGMFDGTLEGARLELSDNIKSSNILDQYRRNTLKNGGWYDLVRAWEIAPDKSIFAGLERFVVSDRRQEEFEQLMLSTVPTSSIMRVASLRTRVSPGVQRPGFHQNTEEYFKRIYGAVLIQPRGNSPIKLTQNKYLVQIAIQLTLNEQYGDGKSHSFKIVRKEVILTSKNNYNAQVEFDYGDILIARAERNKFVTSSMALFENPQVSVKFESIKVIR